MKTTFFLASLMLLLSSCRFSEMSTTYDSGRDENGNITKIEASDTKSTKRDRLGTFDKIDIDIVGTVTVRQDKNATIEITGPDNLVNLFTYAIDNGKLSLKLKRGYKVKGKKKIDIVISSPTLTEIANNGVGTINVEKLTTPSLAIKSSGVGECKLTNIQTSGLCSVSNDGVGSIYISNLTSESFKADNSGVGSIEVSGTAKTVRLDNSGVGSINAAALKGEDVVANCSGVGSVEGYASETAEYSKSGVGSVDIQGGGKVTKK